MPQANSKKGSDPNSDLADRLLHALIHPFRRRMLQYMASEPASAKMLSTEFRAPLGNVSYHLSKVLFETCGVVKLVESNQRRGALEKIYALRPEAYLGVKWPEIPPSMRSAVQGVAFSTFMTLAIASIEAEAKQGVQGNIFSFEPVAVDVNGRREIAHAIRTLQDTVRSVAQRCTTVDPDNLSQIIVGTAAFVPATKSEEDSE